MYLNEKVSTSQNIDTAMGIFRSLPWNRKSTTDWVDILGASNRQHNYNVHNLKVI